MTLADAAPSPTFMGNLVIAFVALSSLASVVVSVVALRRQPPLAEEIKSTFAKTADVNADVLRLHVRIDESDKKIEHKIEQLSQNLARNQRDADLSRGRMEGKLNMLILRFLGKNALDESEN